MPMTNEAQPLKDQPLLPGLLGNPDMTLQTDPRTDPRLATALAEVGLAGAAPPAPVTSESTMDEILDFISVAEIGFKETFNALFSGLPKNDSVAKRTEIIDGVDGNKIKLYIHKPKDASGSLPCVYHTHGGGMAILEGSDIQYERWRDELSASGMVVVGVEFRNAAGTLGNHPFPAALNDCMSGLKWTFDNKDVLGISKIIISGESGGGNLALATTLMASQEGRLNQIDGVYALCPYISNAWTKKTLALPSLYENDGYLLNCSLMGSTFAVAYDPECQNAKNPLCWPYFAKAQDLQSLPPHVISVNELDPLRDEGLKYYQMLMSSGVSVYSRTVNGTCHAAEVLFLRDLPDVSAATIRDIKGFADSL